MLMPSAKPAANTFCVNGLILLRPVSRRYTLITAAAVFARPPGPSPAVCCLQPFGRHPPAASGEPPALSSAPFSAKLGRLKGASVRRRSQVTPAACDGPPPHPRVIQLDIRYTRRNLTECCAQRGNRDESVARQLWQSRARRLSRASASVCGIVLTSSYQQRDGY
jgi:hypothetical protein